LQTRLLILRIPYTRLEF